VPETRADYSSFGATVYVPTGWSGKMPNGDAIVPGATFTSIRSWYKSDPNWSQVQTYLNGGAAPVFTYHRFWAQADIAMAYAVYGELFEGAGTGPTATPPTVPTGLAASNVTSTSVTLSWTASTDPSSSVAGYTVYRGSTKVGLTTGTSYTDSGLTAATTYSYTVTAQDPAGDTSAASTALSVTTAAAAPGGSCTVVYSVSSDWGTGFNGNVTITNNGTTATKTWQVTWTWPGNQTITNMWNAGYTQTGASVTANDLSYDNAIAPGASTSFGFGATYSGANTAPKVTVTST
jgi:chitodextrinase